MTDYDILKEAFLKIKNIEEYNPNPTSYHINFENGSILIYDEHGLSGTRFTFNQNGSFNSIIAK